jgi:hypothetical protein
MHQLSLSHEFITTSSVQKRLISTVIAGPSTATTSAAAKTVAQALTSRDDHFPE